GGGLPEAGAVEAATGFEADAVVAGIDHAALDEHASARIDIDAVARALDAQILDHDVGAEGRVSGPVVAALADGKALPAHVVAVDKLDDERAARLAVAGGGARVALDVAGAD